MRVIVFRSRLKDGVLDEYGRRVDRIAALARQMPGFVASKDFTADDGERVAVIEFSSAEELEGWRNHPEHRAAQNEGRDRFYEQYSIQVCELLRESRFVATETTRAASVTTTDFDAGLLPAHESHEGGCFCGRIRYRATGRPQTPSICHCTMCRRISGSPMVGWATFRTDDLEWVAGSPKRFGSSPEAERSFCGDCGTALTFRLEANPDWTDITLASLDEPARITPCDHIFTDTRIPWVRLADGLPQFSGERPA
jgi:heme-degrading monooxygenase HmoA